MVDLFLENQWLKVSPAFNAQLCHRYNVDVLDFNGKENAVFHQYDRKGNQFMEYLEDYGHFEDVPLQFIFNNMIEHYPRVKAYVDAKGDINFIQ